MSSSQRIAKVWASCSLSTSKDTSDTFTDEVYEDNKKWIVLMSQVAYLCLLGVCIPFAFYMAPSDPSWLPIQTFLLVTLGSSLVAVLLYIKGKVIQPIYMLLAAYSAIFPYVVWLTFRCYMKTESFVWNWLALSMVFLLLLGSPRAAFGLLLLQILTPAAGALADIQCGFGLEVRRFIARYICVAIPPLALYCLLKVFCRMLVSHRAQAKLQHDVSMSLLHNTLPVAVSGCLMDQLARGGPIQIAHSYSEVSVAFADIVGFTALCLSEEPTALIKALNDIFSFFDRLCFIFGVEKLKTIGDAYMFAGFPQGEAARQAALAVVRVAVGMVRHVAEFPVTEQQLQVRMGVHTGPVLAGVVGFTKFAYDVWGPTVNFASRLESHGIPGLVQVSAVTQALIEPDVPCEFRARISLKGAGMHEVYVVQDEAVPDLEGVTPEALQGLGPSELAALAAEIHSREDFGCSTVDSRSAMVPVGLAASPPAGTMPRPDGLPAALLALRPQTADHHRWAKGLQRMANAPTSRHADSVTSTKSSGRGSFAGPSTVSSLTREPSLFGPRILPRSPRSPPQPAPDRAGGGKNVLAGPNTSGADSDFERASSQEPLTFAGGFGR